jgi:mannobiose 2-epimerase
VILGARILWTFAAAHRCLGGEAYLPLAGRARDYLQRRFLDPRYGGVYWMLDADGEAVDERKHVYAQAFAVYALAEHHRATGDAASLAQAIALQRLLESHGADAEHGGYREAFSRDWQPLEDVRLSEKDALQAKSANTHLHLLEAYSTLLRSWPDPGLAERLRALVELFLGPLYDPGGAHFRAFFDADWTPRSDGVSWGHDIETAWLLLEGAEMLGDAGLRERVRAVAVAVARAVLAGGVDADGGLLHESGPEGVRDGEKHWWVQAEAIVGFAAAWQETGDGCFLEAAQASWDFVRRRIRDPELGEWRWGVTREGTPLEGEDLAGPWKCPYHHARACLEVMARAGTFQGS